MLRDIANIVNSVELTIGGERIDYINYNGNNNKKFICKNIKCRERYDEKPEKCTNIINEFSKELFKKHLFEKEKFNATDEEMIIIEDTKYFRNKYEGRLKELYQNLVKKYLLRENMKLSPMLYKIDKFRDECENEEDWDEYNNMIDKYADISTNIYRNCDTIFTVYCAYYRISMENAFMIKCLCNEKKFDY